MLNRIHSPCNHATTKMRALNDDHRDKNYDRYSFDKRHSLPIEVSALQKHKKSNVLGEKNVCLYGLSRETKAFIE